MTALERRLTELCRRERAAIPAMLWATPDSELRDLLTDRDRELAHDASDWIFLDFGEEIQQEPFTLLDSEYGWTGEDAGIVAHRVEMALLDAMQDIAREEVRA